MKTTGFHFGVPVVIAGKTFYIDINRDGAQERISECMAQINDVAARAEAAENNEDWKFVLDKAKAMVDAVLGDGSFDEIFEGRRITGYDVGQVITYLGGEARREVQKIRKMKK